ncbi:chorismate lyase [Methylolobus aquaticus]|nr:chorismate lyase [Methylolobus aquaticus]
MARRLDGSAVPFWYTRALSLDLATLRHRSLLLKSEPCFGVTLSGLSAREHPSLRNWLQERGSLTRRLRALCGPSFRVAVLGEAWRQPFHGEAARLRSHPRRRVWTREVALLAGDRPLIVARSLMPHGMLRGRHAALIRLGQRPLGDWLFTNPDLTRLALEFARVQPEQWHGLPPLADAGGTAVWGRRALYRIGRQRLLVCEFFLPALFRLEDEAHGYSG